METSLYNVGDAVIVDTGKVLKTGKVVEVIFREWMKKAGYADPYTYTTEVIGPSGKPRKYKMPIQEKAE